jgi:hypothetical protein
MALRDSPRRWGRWVGFFIEIYTYIGSIVIYLPTLAFPVPQGRREWVDGGGQLWITLTTPSFLGRISSFRKKHRKITNIY